MAERSFFVQRAGNLSSRRTWLTQALGALGAGWFLRELGVPAMRGAGHKPIRVAAVVTEFRFRSHAHVLLENFLMPYLFRGRVVRPPVEVVSFYVDQFPEGDMARDVARRFNIPIFDSIDKALCLGGQQLAVDAVLAIGEHGNYPVNDLGQVEYPRKRFFDACVAVMRRSGRYVPYFNDKHLSYRADWAQQMYDTARKLGIPLMAGSSVPLAQRIPPVEIPRGSRIREAVSIHGGPFEIYDFHGLEVLQAMVEARQGGECGIRRVEFLEGEKLWAAGRQGRWSIPLAEAAMAVEPDKKKPSLQQALRQGQFHGILLEYGDGLRAAVLKVGSSGIRWNFACYLHDSPKPLATYFYPGPWNNRNLFKALSHAIQHFFVHRESPYPVERTLLTTLALEAAVRSRAAGKPIQSPRLQVRYQPRDFRAFRENGASWRIITEQTPQPQGFDNGTPEQLLRSAPE